METFSATTLAAICWVGSPYAFTLRVLHKIDLESRQKALPLKEVPFVIGYEVFRSALRE